MRKSPPVYSRVMLSEYEQRLQSYMEGFITSERKRRMKKVLSERTRYVICVLENLFDPRNGSAIIRHCDALGIHELHVIEHTHPFKSDRQVDLGTAQWLDMTVYRRASRKTGCETVSPFPVIQTPSVLATIKSRGYRIVVTSPHADNDALPETLDLQAGPVAIVFGTEKHGISKEAREVADVFLRIPMVGFVESFNVSASAAIMFHVLSRRIRKEGLPWRMEAKDAERVMYEWVRRTAPHAESLVRRFEESHRT